MKILVCGGRDFADYQAVRSVLDAYIPEDTRDLTIAQGEARGADTLARYWAKTNGIVCLGYPAKWDYYGKSAGMRRNEQMLTEFKPDLVIAFPGGAGTRGMMRIAQLAKVKVIAVSVVTKG